MMLDLPGLPSHLSRMAPVDLKEEILRLKKERNAIILAHSYQTADIQDIADLWGIPWDWPTRRRARTAA